ncbi:unnamed protein product [Closterium sp. Yama58-4]|nr:unnamed protein product [Closterium sp. Yama58-4]
MVHHVTTTRRFASSNVTTNSRCYSPSTTAPRLSPRVAATRLVLVLAVVALSVHASWAEDTSVAFNAVQLAALDALKVEWGAFSYSTSWTSTAQCLLYPKSPKVAVRWGLNCDADGNVIRLDLHGLGCVGSFSTSLSKLTALTMLDLSFNSITGSIPDFISTLDKLQFLSLNYMPLTGSLPSGLANLRSLNYLGVSNAQLTGPIPAAFRNFKSLETLSLANNQLTGALGALPYMTHLRDIYLSSNAFTGSLPAALANAASLHNIDVSNNRLSGSIPAAYSKLKKLESFNISGNQITGTIPNAFTSGNIWALDLSSNTLSGALPKSISNLPRIQLLNTQANSLTGKIPAFKSPQLAGLNVANNYFYGPGKTAEMKVAVQGCAHGELDDIYATIDHMRRQRGIPIDLLLCCGDFQAIRNTGDLESLACPPKYRSMNSFWKYYAGRETPPVPTVFVGGNHEASNYLWDLYFGGWAAPSIYFLGFAGVVRFGGLRIGGLSGIYKSHDFRLGHYERPPYNDSQLRSIYHVREYDVTRLAALTSLPSSLPSSLSSSSSAANGSLPASANGSHMDVFLSHDWPRGVEQHGDTASLLRAKPFFRGEVERNALGSPAGETLLHTLRPSYWFSAHLHVKFSALVKHSPAAAASPAPAGVSLSSSSASPSSSSGVTRFLALDKCLPGRQFLQVIDFPDIPSSQAAAEHGSAAAAPPVLEYDPQWLAVTRAYAPYLPLSHAGAVYPPGGVSVQPHLDWVAQRLAQQPGGAAIPANFTPTAPPYDPDRPHARVPTSSVTTLNPQTAAFLDLLDLPHSTFLRGGSPSPSPAAPPPAAAASPTIWNSDSCPPDTYEDPESIPADGDADDDPESLRAPVVLRLVAVKPLEIPLAQTPSKLIRTNVTPSFCPATFATLKCRVAHQHPPRFPPLPQLLSVPPRPIQVRRFDRPISAPNTTDPLNHANPATMSGSGNGVVATYNGTAEAGGAGTFSVKAGLAQMLKGGVIMDVVNVEQARIAEEAGAVAVMALERVPADIRAQGGVARMSDPQMIKEIKKAVTIPVMAKARIGHFVEAQVLEAIGIDYIDESEVLTPADDVNHINKHRFAVPFVCGCRNLGEALRRVAEGAAMIRTKGEAGTGDVIEAVRHVRSVQGEIRRLKALDEDELYVFAKELRAPLDLVKQTRELGRLPVVNFAAGGVATPADAAMMMQLGCDGVFVGSGIFKSGDPAKRARAIVQAVTHYTDPKVIAEVSCGLGEAMVGINCSFDIKERYAARSE